MEKLKLNGLGNQDIPTNIRETILNLYNELSNKINDLIDWIQELEDTINTK